MDLTPDFEALTASRGKPRARRYTQLADATRLVNMIKKMKDNLFKQGHDYLNTYGYLPGASTMKDEARIKLEVDVEKFIDDCEAKIRYLQSEIRLGTNSEQVIEHGEAVIRIVRRILNDLFKYFSHLRSTKIRRNLEKDKFDRIECAAGTMSPSRDLDSIDSDNLSLDKLTSITKEERFGTSTTSMQTSSFHESNDGPDQSSIASEYDTSMNEKQMQMLARENTQIYEELMTLDDELKIVGRKVAQISKLQELFTEKVMEQAVDLNNLHETTIRSSEHVREGNDLIRDAMMKNASTRVFILFYIITLGFTILFLDWYNP